MLKDKEKEIEENKEKEKKEQEKTMEENLTNPIFVNYNFLKSLEEIKKINYSILELLNKISQELMSEEREGVIKSE